MKTDRIKLNLKESAKYLAAFLKWIVISIIVGIIGGIVGSVFHKSIDFVTELRIQNDFMIYLLPLGGLFIVVIYYLFSSKGRIDTNRVIESVRKDKDIPIVIYDFCMVKMFLTYNSINFQNIHISLADLWHPLEGYLL